MSIAREFARDVAVSLEHVTSITAFNTLVSIIMDNQIGEYDVLIQLVLYTHFKDKRSRPWQLRNIFGRFLVYEGIRKVISYAVPLFRTSNLYNMRRNGESDILI